MKKRLLIDNWYLQKDELKPALVVTPCGDLTFEAGKKALWHENLRNRTGKKRQGPHPTLGRL